MFVGVILNPQARRNRRAGRNRLARLRDAIGPWGELTETASVDELGGALEAMLPRATHLVSDGGDGALNCMIHEVRARRPDPASWPAFIPTNGGTIDFVARKAGVEGRALSILRALRRNAEEGRAPIEVALDSLHLVGRHADGAPFDRIGFALAAGGIGNRFFDKYYEDDDPSPTTIVRIIARTIAGYGTSVIAGRPDPYAAHLFSPTRARVSIDGAEVPSDAHAGLHAGAFDVNLGGVVRVFPQARAAGVLHFQAGSLTPAQIIRNLPRIVSGAAIMGPGLRDTAGERMHIDAAPGERLAPILDGERFTDLVELDVSRGPTVRIARPR
ncbi:MAG: retinol dehydrogenase [Sandaracinaceae bacterium]